MLRDLSLWHTVILLAVVNNAYAATPFTTYDALTENGIEWCEENHQLYKILGYRFFEHHKHSIESRVCASLYEDILWGYNGLDRTEKLIEKSKYYFNLEKEESRIEAETGILDPLPAGIDDIFSTVPDIKSQILPDDKNKTLEEKIDDLLPIEQITQNNAKSAGGCLIATAAYGTELAPQVQMLREIRDNRVMRTESGAIFVSGFNQIYYTFSPQIADYQRENPTFKEAVRVTITPMISSLSILSLTDIDSEHDMIAYGIGIILLNIGMYIGVPLAMVCGFRRIKLF